MHYSLHLLIMALSILRLAAGLGKKIDLVVYFDAIVIV